MGKWMFFDSYGRKENFDRNTLQFGTFRDSALTASGIQHVQDFR